MKKGPKKDSIQVIEAAEHNLQKISVTIPHNELTVITGVSGSGKSSLAYNVLFRESQRRFMESFSAYSRQYLGKMEKPDVKEITGLQPALAINQKTVISNPRSTVGTMSGIYDYLRLLYARTGDIRCLNCHNVIKDRGDEKCNHCDTPFAPILAKLFSFNSPFGACPACKGLGIEEHIDRAKLIANENKTLREGALIPTTPTGYIVYSQVRVDELDRVCNEHGFSVDIPWKDLTEEQQDVIWNGSARIKILFGKHSLESRLKWKGITAKPREESYYKGMIPIMEEILHRDRNDNILRFASAFQCSSCHGKRLKREALAVTIQDKTISDLANLALSDLNNFLKSLTASIQDKEVTEFILEHAIKRLNYLELLGLDYLTLGRESTSLSGGEAQRIRLASQVGSDLQGILYILDEPSIGLHPRDNEKLLDVLKSLRDNGNTVVVVEHDEDTIRSADYLIDIGPKAGIHGGELLYQGRPEELLDNPGSYSTSLTAEFLSGRKTLNTARQIRDGKGILSIRGANKNNLKYVDVDFMCHAFNVVTGVSGAGKSTLIHQVLAPALRNPGKKANFESISCPENIKRIIEIDQSPIGRTPRSNPATYTGLFDHIRELFGNLPESKNKGYKKGRFSFNNAGGRCETCQGAGSIQLGMHFLGDIEIPCEDCKGQRFNPDTLAVKYRDRNIFEVLGLSIEEAQSFFEGENKIIRILDQLLKLDVGYLKLGQPSTTLSGGEAQRVKLASELHKTSSGHNLYILDEPTVGLHKADISYLINAIGELVDNDNTVIVIEHDRDIILQANHIVDLGPEGGARGGQLVVQGSIEDIIRCKGSFTGKALKEAKKTRLNPANHPPAKNSHKDILFTGLKTNNLQNIDVCIPLNQLTVITGVSGSGKSSLAFDSIYAESRNRFTESLSTYARRMMSKVKKADLEHCSGLTPAIAIRQNPFKKNPRSTVGTATEIYDLYRLLFSRAGTDRNGSYTGLQSSAFSFNNLDAACKNCGGLGIKVTTKVELLVTDPEKPIIAGAMDGSLPGRFFGDPNGQFVNTLIKVGKQKGIDFSVPFAELPSKALSIAIEGTGKEIYQVEWKFKRGNRSGTHQMSTVWKGFVKYVNEEYFIKQGGKRAKAYEDIMGEIPCPLCNGLRLKQEALSVSFGNLHINQLVTKSVRQALDYFTSIHADIEPGTLARSKSIIDQIISRLKTLNDIGLDYITIDRPTSTLSGGEAQRLRIATQLVADLCGLTYVLDEPTIGLHARDTAKLMETIQAIKKRGDTVVIVEHDPEVIANADHIIDMGPGAGSYGGRIIGQGSFTDIRNLPGSITGSLLKAYKLNFPEKKRKLTEGIKIRGAYANNLKNLDVEIPAGGIVTLTGVSGSGKTSLAFEVIANSYNSGHSINCQQVNFNGFKEMRVIDQHKIGTSPLSTPATYTGLFDLIRDEFAKQAQAKSKGLKRSHFSFNSRDGRCETCKGMGRIKVSLDFLSDMWVNCDVCHGKRYKPSVLEVTFKTHSVSDILEMEIKDAISIFEENRKISEILKTLENIGLGYLKLGQPTSTLSGGETQRLKLATHLSRQASEKTMFIFDEPTTGLHLYDIAKLLNIFNDLASQGHSLLVIEHNPQIIASSNWTIDLGPEGGDRGGEVVYSGPPSGILNCKESKTGLLTLVGFDLD